MDFSENYKQLLKNMNVNKDKKTLKHNINKNSFLTPYTTREPERVDFEGSFDKILGEISRLELDKVWDDNFENPLSLSDIKDIEIDDEDAYFFNEIIKEYIFDDNKDLKIVDPHLFLYMPLSKQKSPRDGEKKIAHFFRDVFCKDNEKLKEFFRKKDSEHIIINLILNNIYQFEENETKIKYVSIFDNIVECFNEDINHALNHKNFLIENISKIFAYYFFFYYCQFILKINADFSAEDGIIPLYYLLDWERPGQKRPAILNGYKNLKHQANTLFPRLSVIDQLNTLLGTKSCLLPELFDSFNNLDDESKENFLCYLKQWIRDYREIKNFESIDLPNDFKELVMILIKSLNDKNYGIKSEVKGRFGLHLEAIAKSYFLKNQRSFGFVLNIERDMLYVITALCVKNTMKTTELFKEYEKRGLYFDKKSKDRILDYLTNLNLIEKKSDSGDIRYVKPIL